MNFSRQREAILALMKSGKLDHPTAQAVHDAVRDELPTISLATVYRNLSQLVEAGEIIAVHTDGAVHYDHNISMHQHFKCKECHTILDMREDLAPILASMQSAVSHSIETIEFNLSGICAHCKTKKTHKGEPHVGH